MRRSFKERAFALAKLLLHGTDRLLSAVCLIALLSVAGIAAYIVADTGRLFSDADSGQYSAYKPSAESGAEQFAALSVRNPEIVAWLTVDGTGVDYPVTQGKNNQKYINTSALGEFSLSGAIFMDARNAPDFSDTLTILYGHNMTGDAMFGSLDRYEDVDYCRAHRSGTVYHEGRYDALEIFAFFDAASHELNIYRTGLRPEELADWLQTVKARAIWYRDDVEVEGPILLMSTCAAGGSEGRRLLAAMIRPGAEVQAPAVAPRTETDSLQRLQTELTGEEPPYWILAAAFALLTLLTLAYERWKRRRSRK